MSDLLAPAQALLISLLAVMPSHYQRDSLQALLGLFLEAKGTPYPEHSHLKSSSALSRFLNRYSWPTRRVIRLVRRRMVADLLPQRPKGRRPHLQVIVDLTCLPKRGKYQAAEEPNSSIQSQARVASGGALPGSGLMAIALELAYLSG